MVRHIPKIGAGLRDVIQAPAGETRGDKCARRGYTIEAPGEREKFFAKAPGDTQRFFSRLRQLVKYNLFQTQIFSSGT
jgi:hypothetical protein